MKNQIEDLIMGKVTDKSRAEFYDSMIEKRENEIAELEQKISDSQKYDEVSRQKRDSLLFDITASRNQFVCLISHFKISSLLN